VNYSTRITQRLTVGSTAFSAMPQLFLGTSFPEYALSWYEFLVGVGRGYRTGSLASGNCEKVQLPTVKS